MATFDQISVVHHGPVYTNGGGLHTAEPNGMADGLTSASPRQRRGKLNLKPTANDVRLLVRYEEVRKRLSQQSAERLLRPLAYFVLEGDRRLPLALLHRTLQEIVASDFGDLAAVPGVGVKKLEGMILVLERAASAPALQSSPCAFDDFQAQAVSEEDWDAWRAVVRAANLDNEPLGRFAPSLITLPRVVWDVPLASYANCTLAEIRARKTHGEKRVRGVLEVFAALYSLVGQGAPYASHLSVQIVPRFLQPVLNWISGARHRVTALTNDEIRREFVEPLVRQIGVDAGPGVERVVAERLGLYSGHFVSVRESASRLGLTRARVYQLLGEVAEIMRIRWPNGSQVVHDLRERLEKHWLPGELPLYSETANLLFPSVRPGMGPDMAQPMRAMQG